MASLGRSAKGAGAFLLAFSLLAAIPAAPALGLSKTACRVRNTDTTLVYTSFAAAATAAMSGDHLTVRGICVGTTTIGIDLAITGIQPGKAVSPTLDGDGGGTVLTIQSFNTVVISSLTITGGAGNELGGGILMGSSGALTLTDVTVRGNAAGSGGGLYVDSSAVTLNGRTSIHHNTATVGGGIAINAGAMTFNDRSSIRNNTAQMGGGLLNNGAAITFNDRTSLHHNTATDRAADGFAGGGLYNDFGGVVTFGGDSSVHHNTAPKGLASAIFAEGTVALVENASVYANDAHATRRSGAVVLAAFDADTTTFTMTDGSRITDNVSGRNGGGIVAWQGCGSNPPVITGAAARTKRNTPAQIRAASGCPLV